MEELLSVLRGRCDQLPAGDHSLAQMLELAEEQHILPWVAHRYAAHHPVSPEIRDKLRAIKREASIAAFYWVSELVRVLEGFAAAGVKVVPLKGPSLGERLYGDAALRVNYDLDVLVPKAELTRAEAVLAGLGFRPGAPDDYHRQWYRGPTTVELHHDVENPLAFDFDTAGALARAQPASFHGQPCWLLTPGDELVFLCLHAVRHRFERLSLIVDLCFAFESLSLHAVNGYQRDSDRSKLLTLGLAMARRLRSETSSRLPVHVSSAETEHLDALADRLWNQLTTAAGEPLDWRALHAFYLEMELPGRRSSRRIRHLRILLGRLIAPDYEFAARLGCRRTWQVRLLRPVRLVTDALRLGGPQQEG